MKLLWLRSRAGGPTALRGSGFGGFDGVDAALYSGNGLVASDKLGDVEDVRAFAFADEGEAEGVHHIAEMIALGSHPVEHHGFSAFRAEVGERAEHFDKLCEDGGGIFFPAFLDVLSA